MCHCGVLCALLGCILWWIASFVPYTCSVLPGVSPHVNSVLCYVMLCPARRLNLRTAGAAWAMTCCTATNATLLVLYQTYRDKVLLAGQPECTWRGYSLAAFKGWWQYLSLGVPAAAMICLVRGKLGPVLNCSTVSRAEDVAVACAANRRHHVFVVSIHLCTAPGLQAAAA